MPSSANPTFNFVNNLCDNNDNFDLFEEKSFQLYLKKILGSIYSFLYSMVFSRWGRRSTSELGISLFEIALERYKDKRAP